MFLGALKARGLDTAFAEVDSAAKETPKSATGAAPAAKR
jgi:hypothetical protein